MSIIMSSLFLLYFKRQKYDKNHNPNNLIFQAIIFATEEFSMVSFRHDNIETFRQIFLLDYTGEAKKKIFLKDTVYKNLHHSWLQVCGNFFKFIFNGKYRINS